MKVSASRSTGGSAGCVVAGTDPPHGVWLCCAAPPTRARKLAMMSRSSLVIMWHPFGAIGVDRDRPAMWRAAWQASMARPQTPRFDRRAAVHYHGYPGGARPIRGLRVDDAELHPNDPRAEEDRLVHDAADVLAGAEDIDHFQRRGVIKAGH